MTVELQIPARPEYIGLVRLVVSSLATARRELADDRIDDLKLAVSEACTNAIEAHDAVDVAEHVVVRWTEEDDRLEVEVEDRGEGFDPDSLPSHPPVTDPERLNFERGLGIPLIRTLVDEVDFSSLASGTSVRLTLFCGPTEVDGAS
ncbi:MAG TPA: ATP-binding protein [Acidimicrobiales bacterium]|nr:ATP-binding protein [Acidimicrobiales bacterium]